VFGDSPRRGGDRLRGLLRQSDRPHDDRPGGAAAGALESFEGNENANVFYRRHGWLEVDKHFDAASGLDKIVFRKSA
jgi:hypothetical protein